MLEPQPSEEEKKRNKKETKKKQKKNVPITEFADHFLCLAPITLPRLCAEIGERVSWLRSLGILSESVVVSFWGLPVLLPKG